MDKGNSVCFLGDILHENPPGIIGVPQVYSFITYGWYTVRDPWNRPDVVLWNLGVSVFYPLSFTYPDSRLPSRVISYYDHRRRLWSRLETRVNDDATQRFLQSERGISRESEKRKTKPRKRM